jgi:WD40 repeat protein
MAKVPYLFLVVLLVITGLPFSVTAQGDRASISVANALSVVELGVLDSGNLAVYSVSFSPDSQFLLTTHPDGVIREWDLTTGDNISFTTPTATPVWVAIYSPNGAQIASADENNIILWDARTKEQLSVLEEQSGSVTLLAYNSNGTILASGSVLGNTISLWDVGSGTELYSTPAPSDGFAFAPDGTLVNPRLEDLEFSQDGTILASLEGSAGGVHLWDTTTGSALEGMIREDIYYNALSFSQDGTLLAAGDYAGNVDVWNVADRQLAYTLEAHAGPVTDVRFGLTDSLLLTGSNDEIRLWDAATGSSLSTLKSGFLSLASLAFNAGGTLLASGSADGLIHLWGVSDGGALPLPAPEPFVPQPGHWESEVGNVTVSFDVNTDGNIVNFHLTQMFGMSSCTIEIANEIGVEDNAFIFGPDTQNIDGLFRSPTTFYGQSSITQCEDLAITPTSPTPWRVDLVQ